MIFDPFNLVKSGRDIYKQVLMMFKVDVDDGVSSPKMMTDDVA